jgi:hypothetical protein
MDRLDWLIVALALLEGSWLAFDGAHALITGDYVTPKTGRYAGQLGPISEELIADDFGHESAHDLAVSAPTRLPEARLVPSVT